MGRGTRPRPQIFSEEKDLARTGIWLTAPSAALAASRSLCLLCRLSFGCLPLCRFASWFTFLRSFSFWSFLGCLFLCRFCGWLLAGRFGATAAPSAAQIGRASCRERV